MASRGPVYSSKETAGGIPSEKFHNHCNCLAVPVYSSKNWPGREEAQWAWDVYESVAKDKLYGREAIYAVDSAIRSRSKDRDEETDRLLAKRRADAAQQALEHAAAHGYDVHELDGP